MPSADRFVSQWPSSSSIIVRTVGMALTGCAEPSPSEPIETGSPAAAASFSTRSSSVRNCSRSKTSRTFASSIGFRTRSAGPTGSATSVTSRFSRRLRIAFSFCSRSFSPTTPLISSACSSTPSRLPYCWIHLTAVFSPTLSMPIRLSLVSPTRAAISGYWGGSMPYRSNTASRSYRLSSETPRAFG